MAEEQTTEQQREAEIRAAIEDDSIPSIYTNGFVLTIGQADVLLVLQDRGRRVAKLNMSYTLAKTLVQKLGHLLSGFEETLKTTFPTTDDVQQAARSAQNDHDQ